MIKNFNKLLLLPVFIFSFLYATAIPVPAKFFVNSFNAEVGQTVEFELKVEGTDATPVYTVITNLEYDKNLLSFKGATTQAGWIPVSPDDVTDTANGVIKRTGGYPAGLKQLGSIYKYTFTALAPGDAKVSIVGSSAYDANNTDLGLQNKSITVKIGGKEKEEVVAEPKTVVAEVKKEVAVKKVPQTINLEFAGQIGLAINKDYTFVLKHNLKVAQETIGSTTISISDVSGNVAWKDVKDFTTPDSAEMLITVPANTLQPGNYTLIVDTKHDNQKTATKLSKDIGAVEATEKIVTQEVMKPYIPVYVYAIGAAMFLWYLLTLAYYKSKKFKKFLKNF
jgi:hypothetical protein